uniref:EamA domain-containing protein n=1 Tax=Odontella aurita TaxID=265563 RepID=A0A7S4MKS4_9STRA|mmetsp:Transcript_24892/g.72923  ORF Transcript_24892/g.72923 Transcript_24892/m.72923 type:complete len:210 (+) Transcript_24892:255-884(+)
MSRLSPAVRRSPVARRSLVGSIAMASSSAGERTHLLSLGDRDELDDTAGIFTATEEKNPALLLWIGPALACALAYALYNIFIKKGSTSIHPVLGGVILQIVAALLGACLLGALVLTGDGGADVMIQYDREGVMYAVWAGVAVGVAEMLSFSVSGMGVQVTQSIPVIIGGSVVFGSVLGLVMLGEAMTTQGWLGIGLVVAGISLVAPESS